MEQIINILSIVLGFSLFILAFGLLEILEAKLDNTEDNTHHDNRKGSFYSVSQSALRDKRSY